MALNRKNYMADAALRAMMGAQQLRLVTPADGADLTEGPCDDVFVDTTGDVTLIAENDDPAVGGDGLGGAIKFTAVPAGTWLGVRARRIKATGTTAGRIFAAY